MGLKKFDRRKESMNKMKQRMKGFYRGKSLNPRANTAFNPFRGNNSNAPMLTVTNGFNGSSAYGNGGGHQIN
jgi:hypothetical protein